MTKHSYKHRQISPHVAPHAGKPTDGPLTFNELRLAVRNHSMPLEALREDITPIGLHYLLIHFDIPEIETSAWRLQIGGTVDRPLELNLQELMERPQLSLPVTLECAGNGRSLLRPRPVSQPWIQEGVGTGLWTGTPLAPLLAEAGLTPDTVEIVFTGADQGIQGGVGQHYARSLPLADAMHPDVLLAYAMNGIPLPPQHGHPLRLVVPGWYGMASVKWLTSIEAVSRPFDGFQQLMSYRYQRGPEDPGLPVSRIKVRALMIPPGIPEFASRRREVQAGPVLLRGRAWSGEGAVRQVEVGIDGEWVPAQLDPPVGDRAWRGWSQVWVAAAGEHELSCRATDSRGAVQPLTQNWNYQGMGNNAVQRIQVSVR